LALGGLAIVTPACSNSASVAPDAGAPDAAIPDTGAATDAPLPPLVCRLPLPDTCPTTAPCSFAAWGCPEVSCEGTFVVTDGIWTYYYSAVGGELVGEVLNADASFVSCPYGFERPSACTPMVASTCALDGSTNGGDTGAGDGDGGIDGASDPSSAADGATADAASLDGGAPDGE